ncbi:MAG: putative rane protein [Candidatus Angelobacter sp.]|jgi:uncharacterized membrane protein|nr:putative rane protein [Candidatus Angelobacter sp.]
MITQQVYRILLGIHIAAGFTAFFLAPGALATAKGGKAHRLFGKIYFWMMAVVALTAILMSTSQYRPNPFLALVAVFSFYAAFIGYRVLYQKRPAQGKGPQAIDWIAAILTLVCSLGLIAMGLFNSGEVFLHLGPVAVVFGLVGAWLAASSLKRFLRPSRDKNDWWYTHMGSMITSYIAAVTAFSAVNLPRFLPSTPRIAIWLWPTIIGAPAIAIWTRYYKNKFKRVEKKVAA